MRLKRLLLCAVLVLPLMSAVPVSAQESTDPDAPVSHQTTTDDGGQQTREQRIQSRKDKLERRLTQFEQNVVKTRCAAAAGLVKASQSRINSFAAMRTKVYSGLVEKLQALSPKLQAAGADTKTYDEQVGTLKAKASDYAASMESLQLAVDDLAAMDCAADPEGFVATLREAITQREDVIKKGQDFRTYLKDTLKPTFTDIRSKLQANTTESEG